jgi:hypothetical protein
MTQRLETAISAYVRTFKVSPPFPFGINEETLAATLEQAILDGWPVPKDYDWYTDLPPDAVA